jgi:DNA-binding GntR family transcriptional regulator
MLDRGDSMPLHQQIADLFAAEIRDGVLNHPDRLPSEAQIQRTYEVSRGTARAAMRDPRRDGLVFTTRRGTFVAERI